MTWLERFLRDTAIILVALGLLVYEVIYGGARPAVLVLIGSILASPVAFRADERRRENNSRDTRKSNKSIDK